MSNFDPLEVIAIITSVILFVCSLFIIGVMVYG